MPEVHVYVSKADKALLAELPAEVTIASLLREKLAELRAERSACEHPSLEVHCPACNWRAPHVVEEREAV